MKFEGENILEFTDRFPDDHSCLAYLSEQKWADGYKCKKCGLKTTYNQKIKIYVCPNCNTETHYKI